MKNEFFLYFCISIRIGKYDSGSVYEFEGQIPVHIFDGSPIDLGDIFQ